MCDTKEILQYLVDEHKGKLDEYFKQNDINEILSDIEDKETLTIERFKRDSDLNNDEEESRRTTSRIDTTSGLSRSTAEDINGVDSEMSAFVATTLYEVANVFGSLSTVVLSIAFIMVSFQQILEENTLLESLTKPIYCTFALF